MLGRVPLKGTDTELRGRGRWRGKGEDDDRWQRSEKLGGEARVRLMFNGKGVKGSSAVWIGGRQ